MFAAISRRSRALSVALHRNNDYLSSTCIARSLSNTTQSPMQAESILGGRLNRNVSLSLISTTSDL